MVSKTFMSKSKSLPEWRPLQCSLFNSSTCSLILYMTENNFPGTNALAYFGAASARKEGNCFNIDKKFLEEFSFYGMGLIDKVTRIIFK